MKTRIVMALFLLAGVAASAQTTAYDADRGFVHPGGLHTQADFDRVKAQLAANNTLVKQAYAKLTSAAYAQSGVQTNPVEVIVRGGGSGENYINACRGATMAYQNALRWKIAGTKGNADAAVRILMAWANTTKDISGDSNYALASGLYGYQFAQAAELMRDYEGWAPEDFATFQQWMLSVWYPKAIGFLRGRNGTWENVGKWWQAPGHYWSNWGLCNAMCVALIGILCDDVFIYNQGMSYFKYDQCGTFKEVRTDVPIKNDGLTDFLGNLVVTTYASELETGAYGLLGQMNESGRDTGHSAMALGLAIDMAKVGWSQGDDLFAYMDHRLAAGIEYVAAQTQSVQNLPWVNYQYGSSGYYYSDSRAYVMTAPAMGAQMRPYWGSVIGIYEGVKGVKMPFSEVSYKNMGIDAGGQGSTSGGYDHLGYSVLMNTRDEQLCPAEKVATELSPQMEYSGTLTTNLVPSLAQEKTRGMVVGKVLKHNELGGLLNTYAINTNTCVPKGQTLKLMPQLPDGEEDTGKWLWNTGETTRDITVSTDRSYIYRVTYTNKNGIESQQAFAIAVVGDCRLDILSPSITIGSGTTAVTTATDSIGVLYGKTATLSVTPDKGWGTYKWSTGATTQSITTPSITADREFTVTFTNQGAATSQRVFRIHMLPAIPYVAVDGVTTETKELVVEAGKTATLGLTLPSAVKADNVTWSTGATGATLELTDLQESQIITASFTLRNIDYSITFQLLVPDSDSSRTLEVGNYALRHRATGWLLTAHEKNAYATFEPGDATAPAANQRWWLDRKDGTVVKYNFVSRVDGDSLLLTSIGRVAASSPYPFFLRGARGLDYLSMGSSTKLFWEVNEDGTINNKAYTTLTAFPFELVPLGADGVYVPTANAKAQSPVYDLSGRCVEGSHLRPGIYIINRRKVRVE